MELKQIKCKNCGAELQVGMDDHEVTCKFCNATFTIDDEYSKSYKTTKGMLDAFSSKTENSQTFKTGKKVSMIILISVGVIFVLTFVVILIYQIIFAKSFMETSDIINEQYNNITEVVKTTETTKTTSDIDKEFFNLQLKNVIETTTSYFFLESYLNTIVTSNAEYENHQIKVTYNGTTAATQEEINSLKSQIENDVSSKTSEELYITCNYDDAGYISEFNIARVQ